MDVGPFTGINGTTLSTLYSKFRVRNEYFNYPLIYSNLFDSSATFLGLNYSSWDELLIAISTNTSPTKVLVFLLHAEGIHNVAIREYGKIQWNQGINLQEKYLDPKLTEKGKKQCQKAKEIISKEIINYHMKIDYMICSSLTRTLQTFTIVAEDLIPQIPYEIREDCRERYGISTCDSRRKISEIQKEFPMITNHFPSFSHDEDNFYHSEIRETNKEIQLRALLFLQYVMKQIDGRVILVVSHHDFICTVTNLFGFHEYEPPNTGFFPLVLSYDENKE